MKKKLITTYQSLVHHLWIATTLTLPLFLSGCETDDPGRENVPELITKVTLTFTPSSGGTAIVVTAEDPDGEGVQDIQIDGPITLDGGTSYTLALSLVNGLAKPGDPGYDVSEEVREEAAEHIFFFSWTNNVFADPAGNGNIDNRNDPVNYDDEDENGLPLGLETSWTAGSPSSGDFRVVLKHQPDLKSEGSDATEGDTDLDLTFPILVQ